MKKILQTCSQINQKSKHIYGFCVLKTLNPAPPLGKLTIIPTPIGNMNDLSPNMVKALFQADLIGCEDRRVAGLLYMLIKNRNIINDMVERFGSFGLSNIIETSTQQNPHQFEPKQHLYYNYSNMKEKQRRRFLRTMSAEEQQTFKLDFLKYRALKLLNKENQFILKKDADKFDELYGIESSDLKHIESQIKNARIKKNRGLLIPLNTYSETKLFDLVRALLENHKVALVSDAGMPCISDPGWRMVNKIRETMPTVPIEVIGGPSSVGIMTILASLSTTNGKTLSGRFEGFADLDYKMDKAEMQKNAIHANQFSINFINAKKLKRKVLDLQQFYGGNKQIVLANELTKKYERKYNGSLQELVNVMATDDKFSMIGQVSYLIYPGKYNAQGKQMQNISSSTDMPKQAPANTNLKTINKKSIQNINLSIQQFLYILKNCKANMPNSQKIALICAIFRIKPSQVKKIVYHTLQ